ncbi:MAG: PKD domain-containing protein, partial [Candidatus Methylacidiphilales bacterium]
VLEALGLEELCNESWSIDNFQLSLGAGSAPVSSATWNGGTTTGATTCFVDITPTASTDYSVTIGACTSPITNIDVRPAPSPSFTLANASCSKTVSFTNTNVEANVTYQWNFGDGSVVYSGITAPNHTYSAVGTYTITLSASISGGCTQTTTRTIKIADAPTSGIAFSGGTGCGNTVQFTNTSTIPAGNTASYLWSFGETPVADTSTQENPLHSYIADGNYTVSLIVSTGTNCSVISSVSVNALAAITGNQAIFTATVGSTCGNYVTTTNSSTGANNQYLWNFGDGNTSNEVTPTHYYTTGGFKTITLTIVNGVGCATSSNKIVNISNNSGLNGRVGVDFAITPSNSQVLLTNDFGFEPSFTNYPNNVPVVYCAGAPTWTYGDGTGSNSTIIYSKKYNAAGTYTVRIVQQTTNTGCFAEASKTVTVLPNPLRRNEIPNASNYNKFDVYNSATLTTGVNNVNNIVPNFTLFPNPNKGSFKVEVSNLNTNNGDLIIVDMLGREVYKSTFLNKMPSNIIELSNLNIAPGTYHLILSNNGTNLARKSFVIIAE